MPFIEKLQQVNRQSISKKVWFYMKWTGAGIELMMSRSSEVRGNAFLEAKNGKEKLVKMSLLA